jgi:hypothetical protein
VRCRIEQSNRCMTLYSKGRDRCYWKSTYLSGLDDAIIREITSGLSKRPSDMTFASVWKFSGAVRRIAADATAFGDRSMPFMLSLDANGQNQMMVRPILVGCECSGMKCNATRPGGSI